MNAFNPWDSVLRGQVAEQNMAQAQLEGMSLRERLALKKAASELGSQNYFAGYEGVPGAERPAYLREAWANADPAQAMQLEGILAKPFELNRAAEQAGKIEAAKKASDLEYNKNLMVAGRDVWMGDGATQQGQNAFSPFWQAPESGVRLPRSEAATPDAIERTFEITPQGFKASQKRMSPFEQQMKMGEDEVRRGTLANTQEQTRQTEVDRAHERVRNARESLRAVMSDQSVAKLPPKQAQELMSALQADLQEAIANRENLLRGTKPAQPPAQAGVDADMGVLDPQNELAALPPKPSAPATARTTAPPVVSAQGGGLPYQLQQEASKKAIEEKRKIANDAIEQAHAGAMKTQIHAPGVEEMLRLMTSKNLGNRVVGNLPLGEAAMRMYSEDNNRLVTLRNQLIDVFKEEGQTKAFDTLPELKIIASMIPDLAAGPDTNRLNMAALGNILDARGQAADFLERWAAQHGGTIDGAREHLRGWMKQSPRYLAEQSGKKVTVKDNPAYVPLLQWTGSATSKGQATKRIGSLLLEKE